MESCQGSYFHLTNQWQTCLLKPCTYHKSCCPISQYIYLLANWTFSLWCVQLIKSGSLNWPWSTKILGQFVTRMHKSIWHKTHYDITDKNNNVSLSVTCSRTVVFSGCSCFLHQYNLMPQYNWNIVKVALNTITITSQLKNDVYLQFNRNLVLILDVVIWQFP